MTKLRREIRKDVLTITTIKYIRELYFVEGKSFTEIMDMTKRNYRTIKKYIEMEDFSENIHKPKRPRKSDVLRPIISEWLSEDKSRHHKQRHTAKRVYDRLKEEYPHLLNVSDRTVRTIVKEEKEKIFGAKNDTFLRLEHPGGEAQVDFGMVEVFENGVKKRFHELILSFPKSNAAFAALTRSETREALLEELSAIFNFVGFVPNTIWFDQMASAALRKKDANGTLNVPEFVQRFATHYGFAIKFCNPYSGHEKGNVERKVGTIRRNLFVPEPRITSLDAYNEDLLKRCQELNQEEHYVHKIPKEEIFKEEKLLMVPVNKIPFDTAKYESRKVNKYGLVEYGKCKYSANPRYVGQSVTLKVMANTVDVFSKDLSEKICSHSRLFVNGEESIHHVDFIDIVKLRPNALKYSGIYTLLPNSWKSYLQSIDKTSYKEAFDVLRTILVQDDMEYADKALKEAMRYEALSPESIAIAYKRLKEDTWIYDHSIVLPVDLPPFELDTDQYDTLIEHQYCTHRMDGGR